VRFIVMYQVRSPALTCRNGWSSSSCEYSRSTYGGSLATASSMSPSSILF
jgi:hypothetical protein